MKIIDAGIEFKEKGFGSAVEISISEVQKVQAIIDFAREEGKGEPIIDQGEEELILISVKNGSQFICCIKDLSYMLEDFFE